MERSEQISLNNFDWTDVMLIQMNDNTFKEVIVLDVKNFCDVTLQDINSGDLFTGDDVKGFSENVNVAMFVRRTFQNRVIKDIEK